MKKIYVQIGAGAGDQDSRAGYRDGFSAFVKKQPPADIEKIVLVEPNPLNLGALKVCWKDYPQAAIHSCGIVPKDMAGQDLRFYYTEEDAPHYQVASINPDHVLKHYPHLKLDDLTVQTIQTTDLESFIAAAVGDSKIDMLSLDIEGIDAEVLLSTDLKRLNVNHISFEHAHLGAHAHAVVCHFLNAGYALISYGLDHNGIDWLFRKVRH